jgi:transposase
MLHIGLDMHKRFSKIAMLDDSGRLLGRRTLHHDDPDSIRECFRSIGQDGTVTLEATRSWYWLYELLEEEGLQVKLANPLRVRLIAEAQVKTDEIDALVLAHLERIGYLPESYIPSRAIRDQRELLRYRLALIRVRTGLKNRVHVLLDKLGIFHNFSDLFGKRGLDFLHTVTVREVYREALDGYLAQIAALERAIKAATQHIKQVLHGNPQADRLMGIPGISYLSAHLLLSEIGDNKRFASPKKLCGYAGLAPRTRQSAGHCWQGPIMNTGNRYIRWTMVEAAVKAVGKDYGLGQFYQRIKRERGAGKARVAVARKLLVAVWHVLTFERDYRSNCLARSYLGKPAFVPGRQ